MALLLAEATPKRKLSPTISLKKASGALAHESTSSIIHEKSHEPLESILSLIVETTVRLVKDGHRVVIVSSGAVGMGLRRMGVDKRPKSLTKKQALASVGQCRLVALYDKLFDNLQQPIAQILLTRNDIADRTQYINAQNTFTELLNMGVVPIVNENDTVAVSELRAMEKFGDNDTLSAITAAMIQADYLFLMTDVDSLFDKNPRIFHDARPIEVVEDISALAADVSSAGSALGTGGMSTKIVAARLATSVGVTTVITRASNPGNIIDIVGYLQAQKHGSNPLSIPSVPAEMEVNHSTSTPSQLDCVSKRPPPHTRFLPDPQPIRDRSFWLLYGLAPHGTIYIDEGAHRALIAKAGLLPVGVIDVEGQFGQHDAVRLVVAKRKSQASTEWQLSPNMGGMAEGVGIEPLEVGRALVNYSATEVMRIKGCQSSDIHILLGFAGSEYVALRENVSLERKERSRPVTPGPSVVQTDE
ncbi:MAG: hypothetical protein Q9163_005766 [Psora crenata]